MSDDNNQFSLISRHALTFYLTTLWLAPLAALHAGEFHVAITGHDANPGTPAAPLRTIQRAAELAQPGDVVTVHAGVYRERVNPPRGGAAAAQRIVYQAAPGQQVEIKGSEIVTNWVPVQDDTWKVTIPNSFFGTFNPYRDLIQGDWFNPQGRQHHTGAVYLNGDWLTEAAKLDEVLKPAGATPLWFGQVDPTNTTIWAQFQGVKPNAQRVEINVRQTVFYPDQPARNYITVRGFILRDAATPWAPPTAEQIGLIGTHWSRGWIIESNVISHSRCVGVTLGKYGDAWDNKSQSADAYNRTIQRALTNGWSKANIGSHIVRHNVIAHCEQAGIVGSLGAAFSQIVGNHIHHIWVQRLFSGAEMGGIKIHAALDVLIRHNRIHQAGRAIWMDWMAQGTRITGNLCYDNSTEDLYMEVDHGPYLVDNNLFLSDTCFWDMSEGGAFAHNLILGEIISLPDLGRRTPCHQAHATALAGLHNIQGGDNRFYNNIFVGGPEPAVQEHKWAKDPPGVGGHGLWVYDTRAQPLQTGGNVYCNGARPYVRETQPVVRAGFNPKVSIVEQGAAVYLCWMPGPDVRKAATALVTTARLGKAATPGLPYENPDGTPLRVDTDYFGAPRNAARPAPGPFENPGQDESRLMVW